MFCSKFTYFLIIFTLIFDVMIGFILSPSYTGYSNSKDILSALGSKSSPVALKYNVWMFLLGVILVFTSINFYKTYQDTSWKLALIGSILIFVFAVGACILSAFFSVGESKSLNSTQEIIHGIGSSIGFIALTFLPLVISKISYIQNDKLLSIISLILFIMSIIFFVLFIMSENAVFSDSIIGLSGLWQRLVLISYYMPLIMISIKEIL